MESFIVSARKYRPSTFKSVVGQSALTTTLKNAIKGNHLAHAYLFCGPRGVGKTTCARIFAKTINCQNLSEDFEACNECESCKSFNDQRSYNIHELDAASNNSVDDIRSLTDQVRIPPQIGKYSVYIIDEVHMLSQGAFNAFLKTLEEPPAHAIFILATTEKHKIIPTILSRCQIYDFNRISVSDTVQHLKYVASMEHVTIDDNALNIIAQKSDGGMRDALSIFDQLVSFCGNDITYQSTIENLNVLDYEYYFRIVNESLQGNVSESLLIFNEVLNKGFDGHHFITGLSAHLRDILVSKDPVTIQLLEVGAGIGERYKQQAIECPVDFLYSALKISNDCDLNYRVSKNKRLLVELTLIRICQLTADKKKVLTEDKIPLHSVKQTSAAPVSEPSVPPVNQTVSTNVQPAQPEKKLTVEIIPEKETTIVSDVSPVPITPSQVHTERKHEQTESVQAKFQRPASISISSFQTPDTGENQTISSTQNNLNDVVLFTEAELINKWKSFAMKFEDDPGTRNFLENHLPKLKEENKIELKVDNKFQEKEILQLNILEYLRKEIGNNTITLQFELISETEQRIYLTPESIFQKMAETNPALAKLKKNLSLEVD